MSKCKHNKRKTFCKECGGGGLCEHDKPKHSCKDCVNYYCVHKERKNRCIECNKHRLCPHNKIKSDCFLCKNPDVVCSHNKAKRLCEVCSECSVCEHNRIRHRCPICNGNSICNHKKRKDNCNICNGCEHGITKQNCRVCGNSFCIHEKAKSRCKECGGSALCKSEWCETRTYNPNYEGYCMPCFVNNPENQDKPAMRNYKTKEKDVVDRITQTFTSLTWVADKKVQDGCSRRRPDLLLDMGSHIIIVEVDENKHTDYDCSCENKRLMELSQDLQHRPIVFIRFNPDDYTNQDGILVKSCWELNKLGVMQITKTKQKEWEERIESLRQQIQYWIDNPNEKTIEIIELFY